MNALPHSMFVTFDPVMFRMLLKSRWKLFRFSGKEAWQQPTPEQNPSTTLSVLSQNETQLLLTENHRVAAYYSKNILSRGEGKGGVFEEVSIVVWFFRKATIAEPVYGAKVNAEEAIVDRYVDDGKLVGEE
ncbi:hypothetical protein IEQ34_021993 [Dendrobium chrysotoxum]|uniref:Uncharacterized protein n=1 Tax=Dendrobium chrysotoxum TaxID=161865 RepID=A0AAV7FXN7_DENCH|nr:hypothetical protein IEQ34_021993 [Dendrobium chrysotoxum]